MKLERNIQIEINLHQKSSSIPSGLERKNTNMYFVTIMAIKNINICKITANASKPLKKQMYSGKDPRVNLKGSVRINKIR